MTLTNVNTGEAQIVDITAALDAVAGTGADLDTGEKVDVVFSGLGVTLTLGYGFERGTAITPATVTATNGTTTSFDAGTTVTLETSSITNANVTSLAALSVYNSTTGILTLATTSTTSADVLTVDAVSGLEYSVDGGITWTADNTASADVANGTGNASQLKIRLAGDDQVLATVDFTGIASTTTADTNATIAINIGQGLFGETSASSSSTSFTFKLGTGDQTQDDLTFSVSAASTSALSLSSNTITSAALADTASTAVTTAINTLNTSRAQIGAAQNRLSFASANLATSIENAEAARSELLDLDIASEMSNFTAKQVLMQAGVSMLAQANQIPQNLLRLFQ
ncbi:MAG: flagellin [Alphaproteobacteria bacterium]|nr:flagellin [Alphaproteobacteria bacterium]